MPGSVGSRGAINVCEPRKSAKRRLRNRSMARSMCDFYAALRSKYFTSPPSSVEATSKQHPSTIWIQPSISTHYHEQRGCYRLHKSNRPQSRSRLPERCRRVCKFWNWGSRPVTARPSRTSTESGARRQSSAAFTQIINLQCVQPGTAGCP